MSNVVAKIDPPPLNGTPTSPKRSINGAVPETPPAENLQAFEERFHITDSTSAQTNEVVSWLKGIGDKLLTAGGITLKAHVSYHLADTKEISAFVAHTGGEARIVVSKGLLTEAIRNEDMLAAVLGHELMHVHFRERFEVHGERLQNTKVEEYVADVASTSQWLMKAGYAPHQARNLYDALRTENSPLEKPGGRLLKPWIAYTDEHGLLENRAQAIDMLIAREIKERGAVPRDVTPLSDPIKTAISRSRHISHIERMTTTHEWQQLAPAARFERIMTEVSAVTKETQGRLKGLDEELVKLLPSCEISQNLVESTYAATLRNGLSGKSGFLKRVVDEARKRGLTDPVPAELREARSVIKEFVRGKSDDSIVKASNALVGLAQRWKLVNPGVEITNPSSFPSPIGREETMPWEVHLTVARSMMERGHPEVLYALWMMGAYDIRLLSVASHDALAVLAKLPELVPVSDARYSSITPSGVWERSAHGYQEALGSTVRDQYIEIAEAVAAERRHRHRVSGERIEAELRNYSSLKEVPPTLMAKHMEGTLALFSQHLTHPDRVQFHPSSAATRGLGARDEDEDDFEELGDSDEQPVSAALDELDPSAKVPGASRDLADHYRESATLAKKFEEMTRLADPELHRLATAGIRAFYLNSHGPCYSALIGAHPQDALTTQTVCRHPLILFAAECTALSAKERVTFLRGLESSLSAHSWEKAYFAGYSFKDDREKLRHLQELGAHQPAARELGAKLLTSIFEKARVGDGSVIQTLAEHKLFCPALRQSEEDDRQALLDHIEAQARWDAPLDQLIDVFWALEQGKLFPPAPNDLRETLRSQITDGLKRLSNPKERQALAEKLLLSPVEDTIRISEVLGAADVTTSAKPHDLASRRTEMVNQNAGLLSLKDPVLRSTGSHIWSEAIRQQIRERFPATDGRDDNSAGYIDAAAPLLRQILVTLRQRAPVQERREVLETLANELELQEALAYQVRDGMIEQSRSGILDAHEYFRSAEAGFEFLNQDRYRRDAVVRFLSQPLALNSLREFSRRADMRREREIQAVTDTLDKMEQQYEAEVERLEGEIEALDFYADQDNRLSDKLVNLQEPLRASRDLLEAFDSEDLDELLQRYVPDCIPESGRDRIREICGVGGEGRFFTHDQALEATTQAEALLREEYRLLLESDRPQLEQTLKATAELVSQASLNPPSLAADTLRKEVLKMLAALPAYAFVERLEDKLPAGITPKQIHAVLQGAQNSLTKSLQREQASADQACAKAMKKAAATITRGKRELQTEASSLDAELQGFQRELSVLLERLPSTADEIKFPNIAKVAKLPTSEVRSTFLEEDWESVREELQSIEGSAHTDLDRLHNDLQTARDRRNRMASFAENLRSELPELRKTPAPIMSIVQEAGDQVERSEFEPITGDDFVKTFIELYPAARRSCDIPVTPLEEQQARQLYELFWSQNAENRAVALKLLILPPEADYQDRRSGKDSHFREAFNFVADQIFPAGMKYGDKARTILQLFLEETDPSLRGFMLAALMAASEKVAGAPDEYSAGKRLSMILSMLGPAEKKLGQAINSHPSTPEDLRSDTKSIKSMSDPLPRWELLARIREALPSEYRDVALPRVGRTLGAASYYIAVDCGDSVLSLLRPHARTLARTGLDRMHSIAIRLSNNPKMSGVAGPFIESIQQAREMIDLETNHHKGTIQQENAWRRYEGLAITVEGERFVFSTAAWNACGPEFRHQAKVHGEHFLDIFERGDSTDPFVRRSALAHLTAELRNILSGDAFDHDRHGAQSKTKRGNGTHSIGLFDHGCMALQPPTVDEKRELATILCDLVDGYVNGTGGILQRAHDIIVEKRERDGKIPSYLVSVERALLALNDFMRFDSNGTSSLLSKKDLGNALTAVFREGQVDPIFAQTIASRFGGAGASTFMKLLSNEKLCNKIADGLEARLGLTTSISISQRATKEAPTTIIFDSPRCAA